MSLRKFGLIFTASALVLALGAPPAQAADTTPQGITVQATGIIKVTPDAVRLNLTATSLGATSVEALASTSTTASKIRTVLIADGVATKDIATTRITVNPEYTYSQDKPPVIAGYRATQSFNAVIRKANTAGKIVDDVVAAAGDAATIDGVTPFVINSEKALASARVAAVTLARTKAKAYAKLLYSTLGKVVYLTELNSTYSPAPIPYGLGSKADAATQVDLGQQDVSVSIEVRWILR